MGEKDRRGGGVRWFDLLKNIKNANQGLLCDPAGVVEQNVLNFLTYLNTSGVLWLLERLQRSPSMLGKRHDIRCSTPAGSHSSKKR